MREIHENSSFNGVMPKYYDHFFYHDDKVISNTVDFIEKYANLNGKRILDVGCGTGIYEPALTKKGATVSAVDISEDMIEYAKKAHAADGVDYVLKDICGSCMDDKYDLAISLSHVIGYQLSNDRLAGFIQNIYDSLKDGGLFIFNFYNYAALAQWKLIPQFKTVEYDGNRITRISEARLLPMENVINLKYRYIVEDKDIDCFSITVDEKMRFFSVLELEKYIKDAGFETITVNRFLSDYDLGCEDWNGCFILKK